MKTLQQLSLFLENKPAALAAPIQALADAGVNIFPSQVEAALLQVDSSLPHYRIQLDSGASGLDVMTIEIEIRPEMVSDRVEDMEALRRKFASALDTILNIHAVVKLMPPNTGKGRGSLPCTLFAKHFYPVIRNHDSRGRRAAYPRRVIQECHRIRYRNYPFARIDRNGGAAAAVYNTALSK